MDQHQQIQFGLSSADQNHRLLKFISYDTLSRLPLTDFQIDVYSDKLNWDILSSKSIPGKSMIKYVDNINWETYLTNGKKKEISALLELKEVLVVHNNIFFDPRMKAKYYNKEFMLVFPQHVDWNWCARHKKIDDYVLLKYWDKFDINILSRYQPMSDAVQREKRYSIKWKTASRWHVEESLLADIKNLINWNSKCKKQRLSEKFMSEHFEVLDIDQVSRYQVLSEKFIESYMNKLNIPYISRYQNLSIDFIKKHKDKLSMVDLAKNSNYNKPNTVQILSNGSQWFVIDPAPMGNFSGINFISDLA